MASHLASGAVFGAALTAAGVYQPSTIVTQFRWDNWHMMEAFLTATAATTSVLATSAAERIGYVKLKPREYKSIGLFSYYDGNIVGGALLGAGMLLSGSCPGTVLAQMGTGIKSGYFAFMGGILGGITWSGLAKPYLSSAAKASSRDAPKQLALNDVLAVNKSTAVVAMESIMLVAIGSMVLFTSHGAQAKIPSVVGGLLLGSAQVVSLALRKSCIGVSTVYEDMGNAFWRYLRGDRDTSGPHSSSATMFACGLVGGAWLLSTAFPQLVDTQSFSIPAAQAAAGGFLMVLGARMAGGCTSGHGISGMSLLSISSMITIGTAMGVGMLLGVCLT
ncbi:hypothetical protein GQ53DRAFT_715104 [Thozetella sp. PMI_491]|nr:hypothetical protein GQ53DRAFT_715104 [Thozetella sp. PMI_491]